MCVACGKASLAALITGDGSWWGRLVWKWSPWKALEALVPEMHPERNVGLRLPWPQGGASPTQLAGLRPAALGLCHLAAWGLPLPALSPCPAG